MFRSGSSRAVGAGRRRSVQMDGPVADPLMRAGAAAQRGFGRLVPLILAALLAMLLTGGCATVGAPQAPETSFTARSDLDALKAQFASATSIADYYSRPETR